MRFSDCSTNTSILWWMISLVNVMSIERGGLGANLEAAEQVGGWRRESRIRSTSLPCRWTIDRPHVSRRHSRICRIRGKRWHFCLLGRQTFVCGGFEFTVVRGAIAAAVALRLQHLASREDVRALLSRYERCHSTLLNSAIERHSRRCPPPFAPFPHLPLGP